MKISAEQIQAALTAALALTNPEDHKIMVPMRHAAGALVLHTLAAAIQNGELVIAPNTAGRQQAAEQPPPMKAVKEK